MFRLSNRTTKPSRHATSMLEVLVALTLLMSVLSVSVTLIVRHGRLLVTQRHYRLALDELSNQMDRVTTLPPGEVAQALPQLAASSFVAERLPAAKLTAEAMPTDIGQRVVLRLTWNEQHEQTVAMTGWALPRGNSNEQKAP